ncbi:MAG: alpha-amylase family glycosyl hydrolase, partial [Anaerolineaceae bacterium]|nr:alpha-amylase family glycosyl hydrolase [Anaerolineaceae bacterium]
WIDQGVDGWRLDVPFDIDDDDFWRKFREVVKSSNPDAYIVGEIPSEAQRWMQGDMFDAVMNYQFTLACISFFGGSNANIDLANGAMGFQNIPTWDAVQFLERTHDLLNLYPYEFSMAQMNLLDSHDMPRFLSILNEDKQSLKLATLFQMTYPGAPCVYYGDEIGLTGGKDPACRKSFPWDEKAWDTDLRSEFKRLISLRNEHSALRTGDYIPLFSDKQVLGYARKNDSETIIVIINNSLKSITLDIDLKGYASESATLVDALSGSTFTVQNNCLNNITISGKTGLILK